MPGVSSSRTTGDAHTSSDDACCVTPAGAHAGDLLALEEASRGRFRPVAVVVVAVVVVGPARPPTPRPPPRRTLTTGAT